MPPKSNFNQNFFSIEHKCIFEHYRTLKGEIRSLKQQYLCHKKLFCFQSCPLEAIFHTWSCLNLFILFQSVDITLLFLERVLPHCLLPFMTFRHISSGKEHFKNCHWLWMVPLTVYHNFNTCIVNTQWKCLFK